MLNKKAQTLNKKIEAGAIVIITVVVLFLVFAVLVPEAQTAGDSLNVSNRCADVGCSYNTTEAGGDPSILGCRINSSLQGNATACPNVLGEGIPLSSLFGGGGIVFLLIMVFLLLMIFRTVLPKGKK